MPYEILEHTADLRFRVTGRSLADAFAEAAMAVCGTMAPNCTPGEVERRVELEAEDTEELLADFLSELLYLADAGSLALCSFSVKIEGNRLTALCRGEPFRREKHGGGEEIKGISYSGLSIYRQGASYILEFIADV
ncbi:MAG TPA: archease [Methanomicrobiales archaeon]|jgi:SHS2 domain-containing protein|nr:archease [Methanomicrobiales archaeon]